MTRLTTFEDAVVALTVAAKAAAAGTGDKAKYIAAAVSAATLVQSELGLGAAPSASPITLTDPLAV